MTGRSVAIGLELHHCGAGELARNLDSARALGAGFLSVPLLAPASARSRYNDDSPLSSLEPDDLVIARAGT